MVIQIHISKIVLLAEIIKNAATVCELTEAEVMAIFFESAAVLENLRHQLVEPEEEEEEI